MSKVKQRVASSQMALPGIPSDEVAKTVQASSPRQKSGSAGPKSPLPAILSLPPVKSFASVEALRAAINEVEPYLAALKGRLGSLAGAKRSAQVRSSKRPTPSELAALLPNGRGSYGALDRAAKHFNVNRRTISRWLTADEAAGFRPSEQGGPARLYRGP